MRAVVQRVSRAEVRVGTEVVGRIGAGLVVLLGVFKADGPAQAERLAVRTARLRIFNDEEGRMNRSLLDVGGDALVVSQFTLAGNTRRGLRPSFDAAAPPDAAEELYERYARTLAALGPRVERGRFRAMMEVELVGDGPVTLILDDPKDPQSNGWAPETPR